MRGHSHRIATRPARPVSSALTALGYDEEQTSCLRVTADLYIGWIDPTGPAPVSHSLTRVATRRRTPAATLCVLLAPAKPRGPASVRCAPEPASLLTRVKKDTVRVRFVSVVCREALLRLPRANTRLVQLAHASQHPSFDADRCPSPFLAARRPESLLDAVSRDHGETEIFRLPRLLLRESWLDRCRWADLSDPRWLMYAASAWELLFAGLIDRDSDERFWEDGDSVSG